jgi:hypothetical protein
MVLGHYFSCLTEPVLACDERQHEVPRLPGTTHATADRIVNQ